MSLSDWSLGPACYDEVSEQEDDDGHPPKLNLGMAEFSGDELDWGALEQAGTRPASRNSIDIGTVDETATFTANPFAYARQAAQHRSRRRCQPVSSILASKNAPEKPVKPIEAAFARQRQKGHETSAKKRKQRLTVPASSTPPPSVFHIPSTPRSQRRWTPPTPSSLDKPPTLIPKAPDPQPKFSRSLYDSPFRSPSPSAPPPVAATATPCLPVRRAFSPRAIPPVSSFQLVEIYEPPPRSKQSLIPLPILRRSGAIASKPPARKMHRPFRSPTSLRPTPLTTRSDESPFGPFGKAAVPSRPCMSGEDGVTDF